MLQWIISEFKSVSELAFFLIAQYVKIIIMVIMCYV
jgi:hypothetical protein